MAATALASSSSSYLNSGTAAAGVSSFGQIGGSIINGLFAQYERKKAQEWQNAWQNEVNKYNRSVLLEQRQYDLPVNQLKRWKEAGLNPYMMLDSYNASAPGYTSGNTPVSSFPGSMPIDFSGALSGSLEASRIGLEEKRISNETKKTDAEIRRLAAESTSIEIDNKTREQLNEKTIQSIDQKIRESASQIAVNKTTEDYQKAQTAYSVGLLKTEDLLRNQKYKNLVSDTFFKNSQVRLNDQEIKNLQAAEIGIYLDNSYKNWKARIGQFEYSISKTQDDLLKIEYEIKDSDEYKETAKRMGKSTDELTKDYVNGITSTISQMLFMAALMYFGRGKGVGDIGKGSLILPKNYNKSGSFYDPNNPLGN